MIAITVTRTDDGPWTLTVDGVIERYEPAPNDLQLRVCARPVGRVGGVDDHLPVPRALLAGDRVRDGRLIAE